MKKFKYASLLLSFCAGFTFCACGDMTEIENKPYDHIGGYNTMKNAESDLPEPIAVVISLLCPTAWTLFRCGAVPPTVLL